MPPHPAANPHADPTVLHALADLGSADRDVLQLGGLAVTELAARFGTPFYAFAGQLLDARLAEVRRALGPRVEILWSLKANPSLAVAARFCRLGTGVEIASLGELAIARAAGFGADTIRFAGPGKSDAELAAAAAAGIGCFHVESVSEAHALAAVAATRAASPPVGVAVRVNFARELAGARQRMGGEGSRFGVDAEAVPPLLQWLASAAGLHVRGLHAYAGTQCFDAAAFVAHAARLCAAAAVWERELTWRLDELDLGGGFGTATYLGDPEFDLAAAGHGVQELLRAHDRPGRRWFVELGRFLAAPAGVYVSRVVRCKRSGTTVHAVLDGGLHHCAAAAGAGTVLRRPPLLVHATALRAPAAGPVTVGGPLCTPADQFAEGIALPEIREGDLLAVLHAGAYGLSYSPAGFLSHPGPPEILVDDGEARVVRERGRAEDALRGQAL